MTYPRTTRHLDRAGVGVMAFRVLMHVARCADRSGVASVTLSGVAAACGMTAGRTRHSRRELSAAGCVRVQWDGATAHVTLTGPMIAEGGHIQMGVQAWGDYGLLSSWRAYSQPLHRVV